MYQKPDNRVVIKGSSDHIICVPEKQTSIRTLVTTIDTLGNRVIVGPKYLIKNKLKTYDLCAVDYKVNKDKIPEIKDFNDKINVDTLNKAGKMLFDANLLNDDDFDVSPTLKEPSIPIRNN